jgi:hypothetical protein
MGYQGGGKNINGQLCMMEKGRSMEQLTVFME